MNTEHRQVNIAHDQFIAIIGQRIGKFNIKRAAVGIAAHIERMHIGLRVEAIGDNAFIGHSRDQRLHFRVVDAQHGIAIERQILDKAEIGLTHVFKHAVMIHMFRVYIGDDANGRGQVRKRAVAFISLYHHPVALAKACVRTVFIDDAAIDDSGVETALLQHHANHGGRRGFAVRSGNRDG